MFKLKTDIGKKGTAKQQSEGRTNLLSGIVWRMHGHEQVSGAGNVNRLVISRQRRQVQEPSIIMSRDALTLTFLFSPW